MMKTNLKMTNVRANEAAVRAAAMRDRLYAASEYTAEELLGLYNVPAGGLTDALAERSRDEYGANILTNGKKDSAAKRLAEAFISPFTLVLLALAVISVFTDIVFASARGKKLCHCRHHIGDGDNFRDAPVCAGDAQLQRGGKAHRNAPHHGLRGARRGEA